jgi:hypothetical protein
MGSCWSIGNVIRVFPLTTFQQTLAKCVRTESNRHLLATNLRSVPEPDVQKSLHHGRHICQYPDQDSTPRLSQKRWALLEARHDLPFTIEARAEGKGFEPSSRQAGAALAKRSGQPYPATFRFFSVDRRGIEPRSPGCRPGVFPLDQQPERRVHGSEARIQGKALRNRLWLLIPDPRPLLTSRSGNRTHKREALGHRPQDGRAALPVCVPGYNVHMNNGPNLRQRWFQFSTRRIIWATFWMALCFGAAVLDDKSADPGSQRLIVKLCVIILSPFVAVGALIGRPLVGLIVGVVLVGGYALAVYVAIDNGWISFP